MRPPNCDKCNNQATVLVAAKDFAEGVQRCVQMWYDFAKKEHHLADDGSWRVVINVCEDHYREVRDQYDKDGKKVD